MSENTKLTEAEKNQTKKTIITKENSSIQESLNEITSSDDEALDVKGKKNKEQERKIGQLRETYKNKILIPLFESKTKFKTMVNCLGTQRRVRKLVLLSTNTNMFNTNIKIDFLS